MKLASFLRDIPDFPKPGVIFKDISPLLGDAEAYKESISRFAQEVTKSGAQAIASIESRGFLFAAPVALELRLPLALVRKPGKLPADKIGVEYSLEYGTGRLELHKDAVTPGSKVIVIDDVLATGGTALAAHELITRLGGEVVGYVFLLEIPFLKGRDRLGASANVVTII